MAVTTNDETSIPGGFLGREAELALLRRALGRARIIAVTGPIGVGKSAVVREAVDGHLRSGRRAAIELDVPRLGSGDLLDEIAVRLGVTATVDAVQRAAPRLVVFDGADERLAEVEDLARRLTDGPERLRIVITATTASEVAGRQLVPVRPLPPVLVAGEANADADAIRLFESYARRADPYFRLGIRDLAVVARICDNCGGLPGFIEVAARHAHALSLDQLAEMSFETLARLAPAFRTEERIRVAVDDLEPHARSLLTRAARLSGAVTLEALEALGATDASPHETVEAITRLVERSLLVQHRNEESVTLELAASVRAVAEFGVADGVGTFAALGPYYAELADRVDAEFVGPGHDVLRRRLSAEWPMLERCVAALVATGDPVTALDIVTKLRQYGVSATRERDFVRLLTLGLEHAGDGMAGMRARVHLAYFLVQLGREEAAHVELERAEVLAERLGVAEQDPYLLLTEGIMAVRAQDHELAVSRLTAAVNVLTSSDHPLGHALEPLFLAGFLCAFTGRTRQAAALVAASDRASVQLGSPWGRALTNVLDGVMALREGRLEHADDLLRHAHGRFLQIGDRALSALVLELRSGIETERGEYVQAVEHLVPVREESIFFRHIFRELTAPTQLALQDALGSQRFDVVYRAAAQREVAATERSAAMPEAEVVDPLLSAREAEVARLISVGHSNPRIAAILVISRRTVEGHVQRILRKGGFENRTEIGVWYARFESRQTV